MMSIKTIPAVGNTVSVPQYNTHYHGHSASPEQIYSSNIVIADKNIGGNTTFHVVKNRYSGIIGEVTIEEAIVIISRMLANVRLNNTNLLFQDYLQKRLNKVINDILFEEEYGE